MRPNHIVNALGIGIPLGVITCTLKLTGFIGWSWATVTAPIWFVPVTYSALIVVILVSVLMSQLAMKLRRRGRAADGLSRGHAHTGLGVEVGTASDGSKFYYFVSRPHSD